MYAEVYWHKQNPQGYASGQDQSISMTQSPNVDKGLTVKNGIGLMATFNQLKPVAKQLTNVYIENTGDTVLAQEYATFQTGAGLLTTFATLGAGAAGVTAGLMLVGEIITVTNNRNKARIEQDNKMKIMGARVKKYASGGAYYG